MATTTNYLPAPIKVENNHLDNKPNRLLWAGCSVALGVLAYYAPKTFLAASVGIFAYQIHHFNQLVQKAGPEVDESKHQHIHQWSINACLVMCSVGTVFGIQSLPSLWLGLKDLRHLHLLHGVGHLAKGTLMLFVASLSLTVYDSAKDLASNRRWVEMEDYVTNYPQEVKQECLSDYKKQLMFYLAALFPQIGLSRRVSESFFEFSQFQPESAKFAILQDYFNHHYKRDRHLAIHQFQQLTPEHQLELGRQLNTAVSEKAERDALPDAVKAIILNDDLNYFAMIPSDPHSTLYHQWQDFAGAFEKLPPEHQLVLGRRLFGFVKDDTEGTKPSVLPNSMKLAALKALVRDRGIVGRLESRTWAISIFDKLEPSYQAAFGVFLKGLIDNGTCANSEIPPQMIAVLPVSK